MPEFKSPVDIANRALQRVGAERINAFTDANKRAAEVSFNYGKLRQAELERNTWSFSTRRAALRPLDINSAILQPSLWSSSVTYFLGSIVSDIDGTLWKSVQRDNIGNQPGVNLSTWVPYFGPVSVSLYDFQTSYYVGELVYTAAGDGTSNVYQSAVSGNGLDPSLPNVWSKLTTYSKDQVVVVYPNWAVGTTYAAGATVLYTDGNYYTSLVGSNIGNIPPNTPASWVLTPILQLVPQQNTITQAGTVVQLPFVPPPGLSQPLGNLPQTSPVIEWMASLTYSVGAFAMFNATEYVSIAGNNIGNNPGSSPTFWAAVTGGTSYMSLVDFNSGNAPPSSQWSSTITGGAMNQQWLLIGGSAFVNGVSIVPALVTYPVGAGPVSQSWTKNVYLLPAGHLRKAPQDPKAGTWSWLGAPGNLTATDWTLEGNFLVTWDSACIVYRFVADTQDFFNDPKAVMFCEGLACRIALEVCETLTQSTAKLQFIASEYKKFLGEAITQNAIEIGPVTPPLDDLIACRL